MDIPCIAYCRKIKSFFPPVQFYVFSDGTYIIDADGPYLDLIGLRY